MSARELDVFGVPYRPIVAVAEPMSENEAYWLAVSNSLISGTRDAVLVDTPLLAKDAQRLAAWIRGTEKNHTTVNITHGHGDHFIGLMTGSTPGARTSARTYGSRPPSRSSTRSAGAANESTRQDTRRSA
jgi:glyoxylase-like metal-dependent hydrolase (beta-lactamase superfamily II)